MTHGHFLSFWSEPVGSHRFTFTTSISFSMSGAEVPRCSNCSHFFWPKSFTKQQVQQDLLPRLTPILKNRHEKVQENCIDLVGRIADRGAELAPPREWNRICFDLLELLKADVIFVNGKGSYRELLVVIVVGCWWFLLVVVEAGRFLIFVSMWRLGRRTRKPFAEQRSGTPRIIWVWKRRFLDVFG